MTALQPAPTEAAAPPRVLDAFISYSRADSAFVSALISELEALGRTLWIDTDDIPAGAPWREELGTAIEAAVAFVFVISPDSVASAECLKELTRATELGKRLVPVQLRPAPPPEALASIQWIDAGDAATTATAVAAAIDADYDWARTHTEWLARALKWERSGSASLLPRGEELRAAEAWLARQAEGHDPRPTELQTRFITAARARERRTLRRIVAIAAGALLVVAALAVVALLQRHTAVEQRSIAVNERDRAQSRALAANAIVNLDTDPLASLVLAARAQEMDSSPETVTALRQALQASHLRNVVRTGRDAIRQVVLSPDGKLMVTGDRDGRVLVWPRGSAHPLRSLPGLGGPVLLLAFTGGGKQLAGVDDDGTARVWRLADGATVSSFRTGFDIGGAAADKRGDLLVTVTPVGARAWRLPGGELAAKLEPTAAELAREAKGLAAFRRTFHERASFGKPPANYGQVAISPDGRQVLTGEPGGAVRLWDVARGTDTVIDRLSPVVYDVAFSPDGTLALATESQKAHVYDRAGRPLTQFPSSRAAFSPDSQWLVSADGAHALGGGDVIEVRGARSGNRALRLPDTGGSLLAITFSPDSRLVATEASDGTVRVWDRASGATHATLAANANVFTDPVFTADGLLITAGRDGNARVWSASGTTQIDVASGKGTGRQLIDARFDRSGRHLLAVSWLGAALADSRSAAISDPRNCTRTTGSNCLRIGIQNLDGGIWKSMYSKAGYLAMIARQKKRTRAEQEQHFLWATSAVDLSPSGSRVAVASYNGAITLLDPNTGASTARLMLDKSAQSVRFSPDGRWLLAAGEKTVSLLDAVTLRTGLVIKQRAAITGASFADGGATIVTAGDDGLVRRWRTRDGRPADSIRLDDDMLLAVAGGPHGIVAVADGKNAKVWSGHGRPLTLVGQPYQVTAVAVSPDGEFVAAGGSTATVTVWERRTGRVAATFTIDGGAVTTLAFSPDGRRLATAGIDGVARIFDCDACAPPDQLLELAQRRVKAQLTPRQRDAILRLVTGSSSTG